VPYRFGLVWLAAVLAAEDRILRPAANSAVKPGATSIIASGAGALKLDGKPAPAKKLAPGVWSAEVDVPPGVHEIEIGTAKLRFLAGSPEGGWKEFRMHPPAAACGACHAVIEGAWSFKDGSCFGCHDPQAFPKTHQHASEVLLECQMCHDPHGSTEKFHLKLARDLACKQCHG